MAEILGRTVVLGVALLLWAAGLSNAARHLETDAATATGSSSGAVVLESAAPCPLDGADRVELRGRAGPTTPALAAPSSPGSEPARSWGTPRFPAGTGDSPSVSLNPQSTSRPLSPSRPPYLRTHSLRC